MKSSIDISEKNPNKNRIPNHFFIHSPQDTRHPAMIPYQSAKIKLTATTHSWSPSTAQVLKTEIRFELQAHLHIRIPFLVPGGDLWPVELFITMDKRKD